MKIFLLIGFILVNLEASSENAHFIKMYSSSSKKYKTQELFFKKDKLLWAKNYSYNGWQIIDSLSYEYSDSIIYRHIFYPIYDETKRSFIKYKFMRTQAELRHAFSNNILSSINDNYHFSKCYLKDIDLLLNSEPIYENGVYKFPDGMIPSILLNYGIPYNENLYSFSFKIKENLIIEDSFDFLHYFIRRKYNYDNNILQKVIIEVHNKKSKDNFIYNEEFILQLTPAP
ncbi:MAG TPA: hypothetical protein DEF88_15175 [Porphyromonadaceae bacterium]|jgi:hypothetical protein|nr:hypothetical protein [Porphyromonadaceae bacterium]HCM20766.1 hypothetical protein [Porphyromonadaceae bacterium]